MRNDSVSMLQTKIYACETIWRTRLVWSDELHRL